MFFDYHMHANLSDGRASHLEMAKSAKNMGMTEIGISDHICIFNNFDWATPKNEFGNLRSIIEEIDIPNLKVKVGAEVDFYEGYEDEVRDVIEVLDADYIIGSVHFIDRISLEDEIDRLQHLSKKEMFERYYDAVAKSAECGLFDVIGHMELLKKFRYFTTDTEMGYIEDALNRIAKTDTAIEINTSGLRKHFEELYPSKRVIQMIKDRNIPLVVNSDAHHPSQIGLKFVETIEYLKEIGVKELLTFGTRREKILVPIEKVKPSLEKSSILC